MKRLAVVLVICGVFLAIVTGPVSAVTIEFWHTEVEQNRQETFKAIIGEFERRNPDIKVQVQAIEENDIRPRLLAAQAARQLPDLILVTYEVILRLGNANLLDTTMADRLIEELGRSDFYRGGLEFVRNPAGGHYGVPFSAWVQGIWYRQDWLSERGLAPPLTWDTIIEAARKLNEPQERVYGIVIGTSKDFYAEQVFTQFALSNGAYLFDLNGGVTFNTPEIVETLTYYKRLAEFTPPGSESWREARDLYLNGTLGMMFYSTFIMDDIGIGETGFRGAIVPNLVRKTGFAPYTERTRRAAYGTGLGFGMFATSTPEEREAAARLVKFLMAKDNYIRLAHMAVGGFNPMLRSIATSPDFLQHPVLKAWGDTYRTIAAGLESVSWFASREGRVFPQFGDISNQLIIGEALYNLTARDWTPEQTASWGQTAMEKAVKGK